MNTFERYVFLKQEIGEYAAQSEKELLAEAFSSYKRGRDSDLVLKILRYCGIL